MTFGIPSPPRSLRRFAAVSALALACLIPIPSASAQFGGRAGFDDAFRPDFLARDVTLFVETLSLEDWQRPIIENLLDDYKVAFESGVEDVRERMNGMKKDIATANPDDVLRQIMAPIDEWSKKKILLRGEFLENVKSQLSDQQQELWPRLDRSLRREKTLDQGEIQGESVNLLLVIKELQLPPQSIAEMQQPIDEFEVRLDEALLNRIQRMNAQKLKVQDAMQANDPKAGLAATEAIMEARVVVRAAQDAGRESLGAAIRKIAGDAQAAEFERLSLERAYPKVYRADPILPLFVNAFAVAELSEEQKTALTTLEAQYKIEIVDVNIGLADAYRREEPKEPRRRVEMMKARQASDPGAARSSRMAEPESLSLARKVREDFYDRYRKSILDILSPDQKKEMPIFGKDRHNAPAARHVPAPKVPQTPEAIRQQQAAAAREPLMNSPGRSAKGKDSPNRDERQDKLKSSPAGRGESRGTNPPAPRAAD